MHPAADRLEGESHDRGRDRRQHRRADSTGELADACDKSHVDDRDEGGEGSVHDRLGDHHIDVEQAEPQDGDRGAYRNA